MLRPVSLVCIGLGALALAWTLLVAEDPLLVASLGLLGALAVHGRGQAALLSVRSRTERELRETISQLQSVIDAAPAGIGVRDHAGRYLFRNPALVKMHEVVGGSQSKPVSSDAAVEIAVSPDRETDSGRYATVDYPISSPNGDMSLTASISTDVGELTAAIKSAEEASRLKSEFVANLSHELRTSLNGVIGMTALLRESALDAEQRDLADTLSASSEVLLSLIGDILDFSKIEAGRLEPDLAEFDPREAIHAACKMFAAQARAKDIQIVEWVEPEIPATVKGDCARLRQILTNLLANALKFTSEGEISVKARKDKGQLVRFEVTDTGCGIDPDQADALFDSFVQADPSIARRFGGTGLGLAICRELARRMGGDIGAEANPEGGSRFWFTVELPGIATTSAPLDVQHQLVGLRALILDGDPTNQTILEYHLRDWRLSAESVARPHEALESLERASRSKRPYRLLLVDLAEASAITFLDGLRAREDFAEIAVVGLGTPPRPARSIAGGLRIPIVDMPVRSAQLRLALTEALSRERSPWYGEQARPRDALRGRGCVLIAEDNGVNQSVAQAQLRRLGLDTALAGDGEQAVEMVLSGEYAAVLMDCQMPRMDGYEATRLIRAHATHSRLPIIAVTANTTADERARCLSAGMDDYIGKPVRLEALASVLTRWHLLPHEIASGREPKVRVHEVKTPPPELLNPDAVAQLRETLTLSVRHDLLSTFESSVTASVRAMQSASRSGDVLALRRAAHNLAGGAATVGATALASRCRQIEHGAEQPLVAEEVLLLGPVVADTHSHLRTQLELL